ncbi:MAP7 domain-containing protein 3 isoform X6 [Cervus canadensis]|uniref:MAP7 domain-containing protein 3 isoform X6 n=1 Tax=Cervus canadensis TaxID=1574408 RepID=UPI001CA33789|nr:MAP7 domain-containing protein 3 isoform X6 [Cervus canadensis]
MAERAGGGTSLRGLRERMVAAANAIAEERRSQGSFSSVPSQPPNIKSPFKPVIDGSVLKNDIKQKLAKERREEKKRQDDANRETQLLEKERKSKIVYEKQMEEKQRKLREQKEKDEQRRISAEKKRNEMLEEEREKFKAVLHRTLERSSHINRPKRWSWEGCTTVNSQNKTVSKHSTSTEKLEQGTCGLHRQMSSTGLQNSVAKKTPEKRRSSSLTRRCSRLHSSTETEQVEEKRPGIHNIIQYVNMPLLRLSSDELKSPIVPRKSTAVMPFQEKVEIPSKASVGVAHKASVEVPPEVSVEALTKASLDESLQVNMEAPPVVSVEAFPEESMKEHPKVSVETLLEVSMKEHPTVNVEALTEESLKEHPKVSVEALAEESVKEYPKVSVETLLEASMKEHSEVNMEALPEESMKEHPAVNVEALAEESVKEHPKVSVETLLEASMKEHSEVNVEALLEESMKEHPVVNVEALAEVSMEAPPKVSVEVLPEVNMEGPSVNVETSPETSEDLSLEAHVDPSPEVSMDSSTDVSVNPSPEVSMDSSQEVSTEASSEASVDISPEASMETLPEESVETSPEESVEAFSEISMAALPEESVEVLSKDSTKGPSEASVEVSLETSPEVTVEISSKKSEMDEQPSNPITKKRIPPSQIPCYRWSSSPTRRWRPPSPISTSRQIQKNCPPSPSPGTSKQSTQFCFSYKVTPVQRTAFAQNALGTMGMKSKAGSNTVNNSETASQKDMICEESGNKGTPGPKNAEEATKILAEKRRLAREQKEKEERLQKEMEQRKMKDVAKKVDEGQEDKFSKFGDGQQPKEMKKRESQEQEDQKVELQKSDAKIKAQEEADKRKKERERIMLQNLQERLERKKRIEEIMKRTRKPDSNASKAAETLSGDAYEEDEADDEDESESDNDSFDDMHPSATINGMDSSPKPKTHVKNVRNTSKFLDVTSSQIHKEETKAFLNTDMKTFRQKRVKDPLNQTKSTRSSTKRPTNRAAKTGKAETSSTMGPSKSSHSEVQKWVCDQIIDFSSETEQPVSSFPLESPEHQPRGSVTSCSSHQPPIDNKNRSESVPAPLDM